MKLNFINKIFGFYKFLKEEIENQKMKRQNTKRENLKKNLLIQDTLEGNLEEEEESIKRSKQSMKDSQGVSDFSGSSYNGPGNVDREKTNSNMGQRNF